MISTLLVHHMARQAVARHGKSVRPAGTASTWRESITECDITKTITLWYNVKGDAGTYNIIITKGSKNDDSEHDQNQKWRLCDGI